jgi:hypothetical protein
MFTAARACGPETRKAGTDMPTPHNFLRSSEREYTVLTGPAQYPVLVPRIIAIHWLRPGDLEAFNG